MGFVPTDLPTYVHLRNLLDAFQRRVLEYCSSPTDAQERAIRVAAIRVALAGNGQIPAEAKLMACPPCQNGRCEAGVCVDDLADSGYPEEPEELSEDD
jgi:hypothetical protein